jgi:xylan 1,4-beta-xylosidase
VQVLFWDLTHPTGGKISDQDFFFREQTAHDKGAVAIKLKNLSPGDYQLTVCRIGYHANDPYTRYLELGRPTNLSREMVAELKNLSNGRPVLDSRVTVFADGTFEKSLPLRENDVWLLSLKRI